MSDYHMDMLSRLLRRPLFPSLFLFVAVTPTPRSRDCSRYPRVCVESLSSLERYICTKNCRNVLLPNCWAACAVKKVEMYACVLYVSRCLFVFKTNIYICFILMYFGNFIKIIEILM